MTAAGVVSLLTDFGPGSVYVGQMHAVIANRAPAARVLDLAHDCPPGAVAAAAYILQRSWPHTPAGTVHVAVVDPGVGSGRAVLAAHAHGRYFIAPDNGLLAGVLAEAPDAVVRRVANETLFNEVVAKTFHGRDVMAPVAGYLAAGGAFDEVGPEASPQVHLPGPTVAADHIAGSVLIVDRFGNLITDVPRAVLESLGEPDAIRVRVGAAFIEGLAQTFSDVPKGVALIYLGSGDHLEVAVNGGRASDLLRLAEGSPIRVERREA